MAAMTTALTEYSNSENSRTYFTLGHTVQKPKLLLFKRKPIAGNSTVSEFTCSVVHGDEDPDGTVLAPKVNMSVTVRLPIQGTTAERDAAAVIFRDYIASDEFTAALANASFPA